MSEIKQINTGVAEIIAVKVPEGAHSFIVRGGSLIYDDNGKESWWPQVYLPSDNWQILGLSDHLNDYSFYTDRNVSVQEEWQQAEENTGTWLILKLLS